MASCLEDDLTCPVCLDIFQDPHLLSCGHTFCRRCVGYIDAAFSGFHTQRCPVCQQGIHQEPVRNLALRSTCESYQVEKEREKRESEKRKEDEGIKCPLHGEKILFFCRNDKKALCSQCRKQGHLRHRVQPLTHTVHQGKDDIKAALRPAEKVLECLRNGTALERKITKCIECQAEQTERQIKEEFEKLHQFLREEEESRRAALREEEEEKKGKLEGWIKKESESLSDRLMEVEEDMATDDITFLSNYDHIMTRARYRPSDSPLDSESLIDVAKHVGNLRFKVCEKMKELCLYYPVVLDPNSSHISVSGDLVCVSDSVRRVYSSNPLQKNDNHLVLGSEAQNSSLNCWDVEVGDSRHWTVGVCRRSVSGINGTGPLTPPNGFWGLRRTGDFYYILGFTETLPQSSRPLKTVRVKMIQRRDLETQTPFWMLKFFDASDERVIGSFNVAFGRDFFPFLIPEERNAPLRIVPITVNMSVENQFSFRERHIDWLPFYFLAFFVVLLMFFMKFGEQKR